MKIFKKKSDLPDVDRFFHKKNYTKLIKLLLSDNSTIVEKAKNALNELAIEEQTIQERKDFWVNNNYGLLIKKLNSDKFASFKSSLHPLLQTLADERDVIIQKEQEEKIKLK